MFSFPTLNTRRCSLLTRKSTQIRLVCLSMMVIYMDTPLRMVMLIVKNKCVNFLLKELIKLKLIGVNLSLDFISIGGTLKLEK